MRAFTYEVITDGSSINISTGKLTSFKELARLACELTDWMPEIVGLSDKPEGVFSRGGDTKLQSKMGFTPKVTLREGVLRCITSIRAEL